MRSLPPLAALLLLALPAAAQTAGGYAGQQAREIKALSAEETADLLAGRGMGLARAGELNGYPGPAHVLELHDRLGLSADQLAAVRASFERMQAAARSVGAEVVERERALDAAFRQGSITPATLAAETAAIGALQGHLRAVHLAAHLEARSVLTAEQVARYDGLRGYVGAAPGPAGPPPAGHHGGPMHGD